MAGSLMVNRKTVNLGDRGSNPFPSAKKHEFNCKYCGELNHFYVSKKTKELKKAIWTCNLCHYKNKVFFR